MALGQGREYQGREEGRHGSRLSRVFASEISTGAAVMFKNLTNNGGPCLLIQESDKAKRLRTAHAEEMQKGAIRPTEQAWRRCLLSRGLTSR